MTETRIEPNGASKRGDLNDRKPTPMKFKLALVLASVLGCFLLMELSLRILGAKPQTATVLSAYFEYDPSTGWIGRPNTACQFTTTNFDVLITHDQNGFRSCGVAWPIEEDHLRDVEVVWCLADSGTWGWGVEDGKTYVARLNQSDGQRIYRNLGLCGYSSVQQYLLLKRQFELGHKPDHVVILFCRNDLRENLDAKDMNPPRAYFTVEDGKAELRNHPVPPSHGWNARVWFKKHSLAFNYLYCYVKSTTEALKERPLAVGRARKERYTKSTAAASAMTESSLNKANETDPQHIALRAAYARIKEVCDENGVTFAVATEVHNNFLPRICSAISVPLLDLSEPWREHFASSENPEPTNFRTDPHYNDVGHRLLATALHEQFERQRVAIDDVVISQR